MPPPNSPLCSPCTLRDRRVDGKGCALWSSTAWCNSWLDLVAVWPRASLLTALDLSFHIQEAGIITAVIAEGCGGWRSSWTRNNWTDAQLTGAMCQQFSPSPRPSPKKGLTEANHHLLKAKVQTTEQQVPKALTPLLTHLENSRGFLWITELSRNF